MIIEFSFGNFLSFRDTVEFSMVAANITSGMPEVDLNNLIPISSKLNLLTSAAIYGPNASGKSNLIQALSFMRSFVLNSSRESQAGDDIQVSPFLLSTATENAPSFFEILFIERGTHYRYGFEVTQKSVSREWLYMTPTIREANLFEREGSQIKFNPRSFKEGKDLVKKTRTNALFLSVVAQFNGQLSLRIQKWFNRLNIISGLDDLSCRNASIDQFRNHPDKRDNIKQFVRNLDLEIDDIEIKEVEMPDIAKRSFTEISGVPAWIGPPKFTIQTSHKKYDQNNRFHGWVHFDLETNESNGTQRLFYLANPVLDALDWGHPLVIDEIEVRLHPLITQALIRLFNSKETNPKGAQLIFTTHDTNLLDRELFRRDQIWFTEKDRYGASHLYSLVEFKPRNDAAFEKSYLRGRYGALPNPGQLLSNNLPSLQVSEDREDYET